MSLRRLGPRAETFDPPTRTVELHGGLIHAVVDLEDGRVVSSGEESDGLIAWSLETGEELQRLSGHHGPVNHIVRRGDTLATAGDDHTVRLWRIADTIDPIAVLEGHTDYVRQVALGDELVVSACQDRVIRVFERGSGALRWELEGHGEMIMAVAISPDQTIAVSASVEHALLVWDLTAGDALEPFYNAGAAVHHLGMGNLYLGGNNATGVGHAGQAPVVIHFLDDRRVVTASDGLIVWDLESRAELQRVDNLAWGIDALCFDRHRLFVGTHGEIRGLSADLSEVIFRAPAPDRGCKALALADSGKRLLAGGGDGSIHIIEPAGWVDEPRHWSSAFEATAAPGDRHVATIDSDAVVRLWDFDTGEPAGVFDRFPEPNTKPFAFSGDGELLATTHRDGPPAVCVYRADSGELVAELDHRDEDRPFSVYGITFAEGGLLIGALGDGQLEWWSLDGHRERFAGATSQLSNLAVIGDVVVGTGYFAPAGATENERGWVDSVSHLQAWSLGARELLWTRAAQTPPGKRFPAGFGVPVDVGGRPCAGSGERDGDVATYDPHSGEILCRWELGAYVTALAADGGGFVAHIIDSDAGISELVRAGPGGAIASRVAIHPTARSVAIEPRADLAAWGVGAEVVVASLSGGRELGRHAIDGEVAASIALRRDGRRLFVGSDSGRVAVFAISGAARAGVEPLPYS